MWSNIQYRSWCPVCIDYSEFIPRSGCPIPQTFSICCSNPNDDLYVSNEEITCLEPTLNLKKSLSSPCTLERDTSKRCNDQGKLQYMKEQYLDSTTKQKRN